MVVVTRMTEQSHLTLHMVEWCIEQCRRQGKYDGLSITRMLSAYEFALQWRNVSIYPMDLSRLAEKIEPVQNQGNLPTRYRLGPAVFPDFKREAVKPDLIQKKMNDWFELYNRGVNPDELYKELMEIHPFLDGNGRVGAIIYNWTSGTLTEPKNPPDFWPDNSWQKIFDKPVREDPPVSVKDQRLNTMIAAMKAGLNASELPFVHEPTITNPNMCSCGAFWARCKGEGLA